MASRVKHNLTHQVSLLHKQLEGIKNSEEKALLIKVRVSSAGLYHCISHLVLLTRAWAEDIGGITHYSSGMLDDKKCVVLVGQSSDLWLFTSALAKKSAPYEYIKSIKLTDPTMALLGFDPKQIVTTDDTPNDQIIACENPKRKFIPTTGQPISCQM